MGKGKGAPEEWVAVIRPGKILFEMEGVGQDIAQQAMRLAAHKIPMKTKFVSRESSGVIEMKKDKMKGLDPLEMQAKLREIDEQSFRVKFQLSMGQTEGLKRLRENRKDRARLLTWLRQNELKEAK